MVAKNKVRTLKIIGIAGFNLICLFSIIYCVVTAVGKNQAVSEETETRVIKEFEPAVKKAALPTTQAQAAPLLQAQGLTAQPPQQAAAVQPSGKVILVDDFEGEEIKNRIGSRANVYVRAPSRVMVSRRDDMINGRKTKVLMVKYDKKNTGGPGGTGGWCGYYTLVKNDKTNQYLDGSDYNYITFWVKGDKGDENFMAGLADEHWDKIGDSLKSEEIGVYLPAGKITAQWQKAKVPLEIFFLDHAYLSAITVNFEAECFPEGAGAGSVYFDDIALEK